MDDAGEGELGRRSGELLGGRHRLGRLLGEGGFGVVYEAVDEQTGRPVAVKLLHAHLVDVREVAGRFRREAATMEAVRHPNVVQVLDGGAAEDGTLYFAMERLEGEELGKRLERDGPLVVGVAVRIAMQIADALSAVHAAGIIHRDLKPDNVFLVGPPGDEPHVKLLDFGVAKVMDASSSVSMATRTGTTIGTAYYMAPEQAQARKDIDARADLYALGVVLFRMLSGVHPFEDDSYPLLVVKICTEPPPPVVAYRADVPPELGRLIASLLAKDPAGRPSTAAELSARLAPFASIDAAPRLLAGTDRSARPRALRIESPLAHAPTAIGDEPDLPIPAGAGRGRVLATLGVVALAIVLAVVFLRRPATPSPRSIETVSLPRPAPPVERRMFAPATTADGWQFLNPLPRAMPTLHDVAIAAPGQVAFAGRLGSVYVFADRVLRRIETGTSVTLYGIAWAGANDIVVVGERGTLVSLRDDAPHPVITHVDQTLRAIAVLGPREWVVVGDRGTFLHVVGDRASSVEVGVEVDLLSVALDGTDVLAVGTDGTVVRWDRREVHTESSGTRRILRAIGGCPGRDLYAVGDEGTVLRRHRGMWGPVSTRSHETFGDLACRDDRMVAAGARGGVLVIGGSQSVRLDSGDERAFYAVDARPGAGVWLAGAGGRLAGLGPDRVVRVTAGSSRTLFDTASLSGELIVVGADGTILRQTPDALRSVDSPLGAGFGGAASLDDTTVVAVGDVGSIVAITHDAVRAIASPTQANLRDVVAGAGTLLAVGTEGTVVRGSEGAFSVRTVDGVATLRSVAGTPDAAVAVGDDGAVVRLDATGETRVACDVHATFRGVTLVGDVAFAAGDDGLVARIEGERCTVEHTGGADLFAVGPGPSGGILAAGRGGALLLRDASGAYTPSVLEAGGYDILGVFADDRDVVLVGAGGLVLRRPRLVVP